MTQFTLESDIKKDVPLAVVVFQKDKELVWSRQAEDFPAAVLQTAREDGLIGQADDALLVRPAGRFPAERMMLLSAGKAAGADLNSLRRSAALAARRASASRIPSLAFLLPNQFASLAEEAQAVVEGVLLGSYRFDKHKSEPSPAFMPSRIALIAPRAEAGPLKKSMARGEAFARSVNFARDLINEPPSLMSPETLAKAAQGLSGKGVKVRVYRKDDLKRMKMNALLGVGRGSAHPPVLVHLHYKPAGKPVRRLAFVGKGVTFDSGGLSLKPADGMMTMKYDMAGAAGVFALFHALRELRPPVEVHGVAPVTENMPGHDAYKPGDVVRACNGKTIEVLNTDAEGRVVLADALSFASRLPVEEIIDVATLTGAVSVALGKAYAALMTPSDEMEQGLKAAAAKAGEKVWRLPLEPSYKDHIRSKVADLKNIGNPGEAGTIIGGLFLQDFVDADKKWAHLDIAGVGWNGNGSVLGAPGASGAIIRTLLNYIFN